MTTATGDTINYNYDGLKRLQSTAIKNSAGTTLFRTGYSYKAGAATNQTTNRISVYTTWNPDYTALYSYRYEYDEVGNITQIKDAKNSNRVLATYTYDVQNQLTQEIVYSYDSDGIATTTTYAYTYDTAGNILTESKDGVVTKTYTYGDEDWNDLLTEYNSQKIAYEGQVYSETKNRLGAVTATSVTGTPTSGNPISYYSGVRWTLDWEQGRNLKQNYNFSTNLLVESTSKVDTETTLNYSYDLDGIRTNKTYVVKKYGYRSSSGDGVIASIGEDTLEPNATSYVRYRLSETTVEHDYVTQNGKIVRETITSGASTKVLDFIYDASDRPFALIYTNEAAEPVTYYYVLNLQGDIVALMDADRNIKAEYTYNAWGESLTATGEMAEINPLRYRGYYYDSETGFYYLQSRYYDLTMHRFINADTVIVGDGNSAISNMFSYCLNNPTNYYDTDGFDAIWIQEAGSAEGMGHSGLMVQDEHGDWFFFYWGPGNETPDKGLVSGTDNGSFLQPIEVGNANLKKTGTLKSVLADNGGEAGKRAEKITSTYYFKGDYTATYEAVKKMVQSSDEYNLLTRNCVQQTLNAFLASDGRFGWVISGSVDDLIPNIVVTKVAMLPSKKSSTPWKLIFYCFFESF